MEAIVKKSELVSAIEERLSEGDFARIDGIAKQYGAEGWQYVNRLTREFLTDGQARIGLALNPYSHDTDDAIAAYDRAMVVHNQLVELARAIGWEGDTLPGDCPEDGVAGRGKQARMFGAGPYLRLRWMRNSTQIPNGPETVNSTDWPTGRRIYVGGYSETAYTWRIDVWRCGTGQEEWFDSFDAPALSGCIKASGSIHVDMADARLSQLDDLIDLWRAVARISGDTFTDAFRESIEPATNLLADIESLRKSN
jgi:hypothetical protein